MERSWKVKRLRREEPYQMLSGTILLIGPPLESEGYKEITCPAFLFLLYPEPRLLKITSFKEAEHLIDKFHQLTDVTTSSSFVSSSNENLSRKRPRQSDLEKMDGSIRDQRAHCDSAGALESSVNSKSHNMDLAASLESFPGQAKIVKEGRSSPKKVKEGNSFLSATFHARDKGCVIESHDNVRLSSTFDNLDNCMVNRNTCTFLTSLKEDSEFLNDASQAKMTTCPANNSSDVNSQHSTNDILATEVAGVPVDSNQCGLKLSCLEDEDGKEEDYCMHCMKLFRLSCLIEHANMCPKKEDILTAGDCKKIKMEDNEEEELCTNCLRPFKLSELIEHADICLERRMREAHHLLKGLVEWKKTKSYAHTVWNPLAFLN
jgi:hypothetical protein